MTTRINDPLTDFLGTAYDPQTQTFDGEAAEKEAFENKEKLNVIIFGATGVGKSTLINTFFGSEKVKAGKGRPVTQHLEKIELPKNGVTLWDTKGIESQDYKNTIEQLKNELKQSFDTGSELDDVPHLGWLCMDASGGRIEDRDMELIRIIRDYNLPLVIVFTKVTADEHEEFIDIAMQEIIAAFGSDMAGRHVAVNSVEAKRRGKVIEEVFGLDDLLDLSIKSIPEGHLSARNALKKSQNVRMKLRLDTMSSGARMIVHAASVAAAAIGASPIPGSDAPLIAAAQSTMIYKINAEFELDAQAAKATAVISGILATTAIASLGKTVVSNALKFIPVAGTLIGGAVSAATAMAITQAIGHAYIQVLVSFFNDKSGKVELPENALEILSEFKKVFSFKP